MSSCNLRIAGNTFSVTFDDFDVEQHIRLVFSAACNSDVETLATLQPVDAVVRTQRHHLGICKFPMFSGGWIGKDFIAVCIGLKNNLQGI